MRHQVACWFGHRLATPTVTIMSAAENPIPNLGTPRPGERRKNARFEMRFPVLVRAMGEPWTSTETADVSAAGAFFVTSKPYLLNTPIEYVLTFPPNLTKAAGPLRVRFFAAVLRCERIPGSDNTFGLAVRNSAYRYLTQEEAASLDKLGNQFAAVAFPSRRKAG